ncbi:caspase-14-like isoform X2 [Genypterus blacodes]|uniref:caspase-14-like isoform X2 n=1 Tax=Genypterus blacodes TaxID=154954 RepID=UPI003F7669BC
MEEEGITSLLSYQVNFKMDYSLEKMTDDYSRLVLLKKRSVLLHAKRDLLLSRGITKERRLHRLVEQKPKTQNETARESKDRYALGGKRMSLIVCDTSRDGSTHDIERVKLFCIQNGFSCDMTTQLSRELLEDVKQFRDSLNEKVSCLTIFIMAHGTLGHINMRDGKLELSTIFEMFDNRHCPALRGKPKLFVIQACRGVGKCAKYPDSDGSEVSAPPHHLWPVESDFLFVYAVCPGKLAMCYPDTGSPLLEEMNNIFSQSTGSMGMFDLFTVVNSRLLKREERAGFKTDRLPEQLSRPPAQIGRREPTTIVGGPLHMVDSLTKKWYL